MERRSLLDGDMTPMRENPNVFDDEYAEEDFDGIADGFRPSDQDREGEDEVEEQPIRTVSAHYASGTVSPVMASGRPSRNSTRSSMRKSRTYAENPFASPEDANGKTRTPSLSFEPDMAHRSVSSASSHQFARTGSPRFGAGPSHPYGMYPQGTIARSPSIATQSTVRAPQRQSSLRGGPQHPYALYPQGVDDEDMIAQSPVPVGFSGLGQSYQRRLGPDGEEQDIIGEDGHMEQLPPYTRYPEDGPEKVPLLVPEAPTALHSRAPVAGTDPTMDLMHTTLRLQPAPPQRLQSMMDQSMLDGRNASMSNIERMNSRTTQTSLISHKSWKEKTWKEKRKTKFCGIPLWWSLLGLGVLLFIAVVLGAVIGGWVANAPKPKNRHELKLESSSLYDASLIASPTSVSPATGTFKLSLSTPQATLAQCLTDSSQQLAWSCDIGGSPAAAISVGIPPGGNETGAFLFYASEDEDICYGTQSSWMQTTFSPFMTVTDNEAPNMGPAFYFQQFYDKLVVLPESAFNAADAGNKEKRQMQLDQGWLQQKQTAQPGDKPWFCVWNNTFIEGFIFVDEPIPTSYGLTTSTPQPTTSSISSPPPSGSSPAPTSSAPASSPYDIITTTATWPSETATWTGPAPAYSAWASAKAENQGKYKSYTDNNNGNDDGSQNRRLDKEKRQFGAWTQRELYETMQIYPYLVKIEERRLPDNTITPYCQQYQILDNGGYNWVADADGQAIVISLDEDDPPYSAYESAGIAGASKKERREVAGGCHCQWVSGQ